MKTLLLIFALSSLAYGQWSWAVDAQPTLAPPTINEPSKPIVSVRKTYTPQEASVVVRAAKGKDAFACSGTAICDHTVLTCWHITRDGYTYTINGKPATLLRSDPKSDVALFVTQEQLKPVKVAEVDTRLGERVTAYGYGYSKEPAPSWITYKNLYVGFPNQSIAGKQPKGRSGGGLFNAKGELVGVCSADDAPDNWKRSHDGLYCGLDAVRAILNPSKSTGLKPSYPEIPDKSPGAIFLKQPDCPSGNCPLIKKQAPAKSVPAERVNPASVSPGSQRAYYTPMRRWGRR